MQVLIITDDEGMVNYLMEYLYIKIIQLYSITTYFYHQIYLNLKKEIGSSYVDTYTRAL